MHDDRTLVEARLKRVLDERIRPAVYPESVPLEVAVWNAPGEPVPVAEGLAAEPEPIEVGARWGAPWGTSWFRVTGTVPESWAYRPSRRSSTSDSTRTCPDSSARGSSTGPTALR